MVHPEKAIQNISGNLEQFYIFCAGNVNIQPSVHHGYTSIFTGENQWPSFVFLHNPFNGNQPLVLEEIVDGIKENKFPPFLISSVAEVKQEDNGLFEKAGFRPVVVWSGMMMELTNEIPKPETLELEISRLNEWSSKQQFSDIINREIFHKDQLQAGMLDVEKPSVLSGYLGNIGSNSVATSAYFIYDEIAGLYFISTMPEYRNHGYGHKMTIKALSDAQNMGCRMAVLHATQAGKKLYEKIGFREYGKIIIYWLES